MLCVPSTAPIATQRFNADASVHSTCIQSSAVLSSHVVCGPCRYGRLCRRPGCYFAHHEGQSDAIMDQASFDEMRLRRRGGASHLPMHAHSLPNHFQDLQETTTKLQIIVESQAKAMESLCAGFDELNAHIANLDISVQTGSDKLNKTVDSNILVAILSLHCRPVSRTGPGL